MTDYALDIIKTNQQCEIANCPSIGARTILRIDRDEHIVHWICWNYHKNQTHVRQNNDEKTRSDIKNQ